MLCSVPLYVEPTIVGATTSLHRWTVSRRIVALARLHSSFSILSRRSECTIVAVDRQEQRRSRRSPSLAPVRRRAGWAADPSPRPTSASDEQGQHSRLRTPPRSCSRLLFHLHLLLVFSLASLLHAVCASSRALSLVLRSSEFAGVGRCSAGLRCHHRLRPPQSDDRTAGHAQSSGCGQTTTETQTTATTQQQRHRTHLRPPITSHTLHTSTTTR